MSATPITDAVYGKKRGGKKPGPAKAPNSPRGTVAGALGAKAIDDLYRQLGFKRPEQRKRGAK